MNKYLTNKWLCLFGVVLATFAVYFQILNFDFIYWDDDKQILNNVYVKILNVEHIMHNFNFERFTFIPLTMYSVIYNLWQDNAFVFHLISLILHALNVVILFFLLDKTKLSDFVKIFSIAIFAVHPLRIESVAWISEWKDLTFTLFALSGLYFYLNWLKTDKLLFVFLASIMAWCSAFSKVQGIVVPALFILLDWYETQKINYKHLLYNIALFVFILFSTYKKTWYIAFITLILLWISKKKNFTIKLRFVNNIWIWISGLTIFIFIGFFTKTIWFWSDANAYPFFDRVLYSGYALSFYIQQFFFPYEQIAIYQYPVESGKELWQMFRWYLLIWPLIISFLIYLFKKRHSLQTELFGILFFILNIFIVLHFIPIEGRLIVAERYTYLAYLGLILFSGVLIEKVLTKQFLKYSFVFALLLTFSLLSFSRNVVWSDTETLFKSVLLKKPETSFAWINLGSYYLEKKKYNHAIYCYKNAAKYTPNDVQIYLNQALVFLAQNNTTKAIQNIDYGISIAKTAEDSSFFFVTKGQIMLQLGKLEEANTYYDLALKVYPKNFKALLQKAMLYANDLKNKNIDSAFYCIYKAIEINPYYADAYHTLGWLYLLNGNYNKAIKHIEKSIKLNPKNALPYNSLGYIAFLLNDFTKAEEYYSKSLNLDSNLVEVRKNRAWIYYQNHSYNKALEDYAKVLAINPKDYISLVNSSFCRAYLEHYNNAIEGFKKVLKLYPDSNVNLYNLAWVFLKAKQLDSAIFYYTLSLSKYNTIQAYFERGYTHLLKNEWLSALKDFNKVKEQNNQNGEIYFWIGEVFRGMGNINLACKNYQLSLKKGFKQAQNRINQICNK